MVLMFLCEKCGKRHENLHCKFCEPEKYNREKWMNRLMTFGFFLSAFLVITALIFATR